MHQRKDKLAEKIIRFIDASMNPPADYMKDQLDALMTDAMLEEMLTIAGIKVESHDTQHSLKLKLKDRLSKV